MQKIQCLIGKASDCYRRQCHLTQMFRVQHRLRNEGPDQISFVYPLFIFTFLAFYLEKKNHKLVLYQKTLNIESRVTQNSVIDKEKVPV